MSVKVTIDEKAYTGIDRIDVGGKNLILESDSIAPSGTKAITENGTYDVTDFASAEVNVSTEGSGATVYNNQFGHCYLENLVLNNLATIVSNKTSVINDMYVNCDQLKTVEMSGNNWNLNTSSVFSGCTALESAIINNVTVYGHYWFGGCTSLKTVQLGSIGFPVTSMAAYTLYQCTQSDLTVTIYVADDAELPLENAPFGGTNATIIYRSATSGDVIAV